MRKFIFGAIFMMAMTSVVSSCSGNKTEETQASDSLVYVVDSVSGDTLRIDTVKIINDTLKADTLSSDTAKIK